MKYNTDYIVHLYVDKEFSLAEITEHLGCNHKTPVRHLKKAGVDRRGGQINPEHNKFKPPLTHVGAYFLGLLFADGNLSSTSYKVGLTSNDKDVLEKLGSFVGYKNIREASNDAYKFYVGRKWVYDRVHHLGLRPNKSQGDVMLAHAGYTEYIKQREIEKSYWRGVIDGDGSIRYNSGYPRILFSNAVREAHEKLNSYLSENNFEPLTIYNRREGRWYESIRGGTDASKIVSHLYSDKILGPVMNRKKEYFKDKYLSDSRYF